MQNAPPCSKGHKSLGSCGTWGWGAAGAEFKALGFASPLLCTALCPGSSHSCPQSTPSTPGGTGKSHRLQQRNSPTVTKAVWFRGKVSSSSSEMWVQGRCDGQGLCSAGEAVGTQHLPLRADAKGSAQEGASEQLLQVFQRTKCHPEEPRCQFSFGVVAPEATKVPLNVHSGHFHLHPRGSTKDRALLSALLSSYPTIKPQQEAGIECSREWKA